MIKFANERLKDVSVVSLVAVNLLPVVGVLFWGWDAGAIVLLYWSENLVVGIYNVLKMACVKVEPAAANVGKLFMIPFFMVHYGGFTAVHGLFV